MHPVNPQHGVRYELTLFESSDDAAVYDAAVFVADAAEAVRVRIDRQGATLDDPARITDAGHRAQLVAIARTLGKRTELPWPRRVNRWRAPGVR